MALAGLALAGSGAARAQVRLPTPAAGRFRLQGTLSQGGIAYGQIPAGTSLLRLDEAQVPFATDGRFLIAFDRDAAPEARLGAVLAGGAPLDEAIAVAPRAWRIERLDSLARIPQPGAEFLRIRGGELAAIAAARTQESASEGWRGPFVWPARGRISGLFGAQRIYRGEPGAYHGGTDIALPEGTAIAAPADGVVVLAATAPFTLEGNLLMIDHGIGLVSAFLHLSRIDVALGDRIERGRVVGAVGRTGRATGPHLHWGMTWQSSRIDPLLVAGPMPLS